MGILNPTTAKQYRTSQLHLPLPYGELWLGILWLLLQFYILFMAEGAGAVLCPLLVCVGQIGSLPKPGERGITYVHSSGVWWNSAPMPSIWLCWLPRSGKVWGSVSYLRDVQTTTGIIPPILSTKIFYSISVADPVWAASLAASIYSTLPLDNVENKKKTICMLNYLK